jgi:hypothetical protein
VARAAAARAAVARVRVVALMSAAEMVGKVFILKTVYVTFK